MRFEIGGAFRGNVCPLGQQFDSLVAFVEPLVAFLESFVDPLVAFTKMLIYTLVAFTKVLVYTLVAFGKPLDEPLFSFLGARRERFQSHAELTNARIHPRFDGFNAGLELVACGWRRSMSGRHCAVGSSPTTASLPRFSIREVQQFQVRSPYGVGLKAE